MKRLLVFTLIIVSGSLSGQILQLDLGQSAYYSRVIKGDPVHARNALLEDETFGFTLGVRPKADARHAVYFSYNLSVFHVGIHLEERDVDYQQGRQFSIKSNGRGDSNLYGIGYGHSLWRWKRRLIFEPIVFLHVQHAVETRSPGFASVLVGPTEPKYSVRFFNRFHEGIQVMPAVGFNAGLRLLGGLSLQVTARIRYAYRTVASGEVDYLVYGQYQEQAQYQSSPRGYYLGLSARYDWQWKKGM
jgi:hypothetical protein